MILRKLTAKLLCATTFVFMPGGIPAANAYLFGGAAVAVVTPPFPTTQNIAFGAKTPDLFGGDPMQYTPQGSLGVSRWLKITAMTNKNGTNIFSTPIFQLDDRFFLDPLEPSNNTYGHSWSHGADCNTTPFCSVTVTEYSNVGMTVPTGNASVITVRTDTIGGISGTGVYSWRENTSSAKGCINPVTGVAGQNCEVTNTDFATSGGQLSSIMSLTLNSDTDTVMEKDGFYNPTAEQYQAVPAAQYTGSGRVWVRSENEDVGTFDSLGNPRLMSGGKMGGFQFKSFLFGDLAWKAGFDYIYFYQDIAAPSISFVSSNNTDGYDMVVQHSRLEQTCNVTSPVAKYIFPSPMTGNDNTFVSCSAGHGGVDVGFNTGIQNDATNDPTRQGMTALRNVFEWPTSDPIHVSGCNQDVEFNFVFGSHEVGGGHLDTAQSDGLQSPTTCPAGIFAYNGLANGPNDNGTTSSGPQGFPFINSTQLGTHTFFTSLDMHNNMNTAPNDSNCQYWTRANNVDIRSNADFFNPQTSTTWTTFCQISSNLDSLVAGTAGNNVTSMGNIYNGISLAASGGTVANTRAKTITFTDNAAGCTAVHAIYPNFVCGDNSLETNRAYFLNEFKLTSRSATANGDGTFAGPVWPQMDDGTYCFAVAATVVDFTKTCAQNGTILLQ